MKRSLVGNFIWHSSYQVLTLIAPLVTIPYVSRILGAEQVGVYSYTYSVASYFALFSMMGMYQYGTRLIAQAGDDRHERSLRFWSAWAGQICICVPVAVAYLIYASMNPQGGTLVALLWGLWVISCVMDVIWLFFGVEEFKAPTIRNTITKVCGIIITLVFCKTKDDLWAYVLGTAIAYFANAVLLLPFIGRYVDFVRPTWAQIKEHFRPNLHLFAPVVAVSLYMAFDKLLLGNLSGMEQAGYFEYADKIARMPLTIVTSLCAVMLPHMTAKLAEGEREQAIDLLGKLLWFILAAAIGIAFGIGSVAPELVPVFLGSGFGPCVFVIQAVAIALPVISASNVIGMQYMLPTCSDVEYTKSVWLGAIVNVCACLMILPSLGALGAGLATILTETSVLVYQCWVVRADLPLFRYARGAMPFVAFGVLTLAAVRLFASWAGALMGVGWALLFAEIAFAVVVYGALSLIWCFVSGRMSDLAGLLAH